MKILVIIALIVTIVQLPSVECEHPQYSFRCLENGAINLFGLHSNSQIVILAGDVGNCTVKNVTTTKDGPNYYHIIPKECVNSTTEGDYSVQIVVYDPVIDGTTTEIPSTTDNSNTTTPPVTRKFMGGHGTHSFNITCKSIPPGGVNKTVVHVFQEKDYNVLPVNNIEVDTVDMRFKAVNDPESPDINTIYVGDEFFMFLKYKGTKAYHVIPKECTAYSGTFLGTGSKDKVVLWKQDKNVCIQQRELLQSFKKTSSPKLIYAEMFGFRFTGSDYITIQCEVGILPTNPSQKLCQTASRKRRGIENEVKSMFAASKVRVYDNKDMYQMENRSSQKIFDFSVWIVLVISTLLYRW